jgi:hypothetical protein
VGQRDQAAAQARQALVDNDKLAADDPRRLNDKELQAVNALSAMGGQSH